MASLLVSDKGGKDFEKHPEGVVAARCTRIVDLGTQESKYEGKVKVLHKIMFGFESSVLMDDTAGEYAGKPLLITQRFTASLGEKATLRKFLESWRGRKFTTQELESFDLKNVLGKPCMLNMVHSEDGKYSNIYSVMPLPAGMTAPQAVGDLVFFSLQDFDRAAYDKLSDGLKETIAKSPEYQDILSPKSTKAATATIDDDDIPF